VVNDLIADFLLVRVLIQGFDDLELTLDQHTSPHLLSFLDVLCECLPFVEKLRGGNEICLRFDDLGFFAYLSLEPQRLEASNQTLYL